MPRTRNGVTPLYVAVSRDQRELVELLLAHNADPNQRAANAAHLRSTRRLERWRKKPIPGANLGTPLAWRAATREARSYTQAIRSVPQGTTAAAQEQEPQV